MTDADVVPVIDWPDVAEIVAAMVAVPFCGSTNVTVAVPDAVPAEVGTSYENVVAVAVYRVHVFGVETEKVPEPVWLRRTRTSGLLDPVTSRMNLACVEGRRPR